MILDAITLALTSIWQYKARAFLTVLGIVIGISSVVMFMAVGEGLRAAVNAEITALGSNIVAILPGQFDPDQASFSPNLISGDILKPEDVTDLGQLDGVTAATPLMIVGGTLRRGTTPAPSAILLGTTSNITDTLTTIEVDQGRMFTETEDTDKVHVIVLGLTVKQALFGDNEALGETVTVGRDEFTVIGLTKTPDSASVFGGSDYGAMAFIPLQTSGEITGGVKIMRIIVSLDETVDAATYVTTLESTLQKRHADGDVSVVTQDELLGTVNKVLELLTAAVAAIASISLLVAGVGIMNIMLVSVTERTKEIGLRKAVGATTGAILWQFLIEAIVLAVIGALFSVGLAWLGSWIAATYSPLEPVITSQAVLLAVGVGIAVGLIFGIAPAYRAARMDPLKALRYE